MFEIMSRSAAVEYNGVRHPRVHAEEGFVGHGGVVFINGGLMIRHGFGWIQLITFSAGVTSAFGIVSSVWAEWVSLLFGSSSRRGPMSSRRGPLDGQGRGSDSHLGGGFLLTPKFRL
jgi:hypothetical protein